MRVLAIAHPHIGPEGGLLRPAPSALGAFRPALAAGGCSVVFLDLHHDRNAAPSIGAFHGLIVLGGPQSANDSSEILSRERQLLAEALEAGLPVFAICLGAQLLARTLGAPVFPVPVPEYGWQPVAPLAAAAADPLFHDFPPGPVFQWHREGFLVPEGAVPLLGSSQWPQQAFRYGDRAWGVQFHPEVTPEILEDWCALDAAFGAAREWEPPAGALSVPPAAEAAARRVFVRWIRLLSV